MKTLKFPKDFLWGVAYSSHQVEGNNSNSDWWQWEQKGKTKDVSGVACDNWNRYEEDHKLAQDLGCGGLRLSLEWAKIEPKEGEFNKEAIEHYRNVLQDIKERGMKRVVTLWHWGLPLWFANNYGWHHKKSVNYFTRYCQKVVEELGEEIDIFLTMNEPHLPLNKGYLAGVFPPGKRNPFLYRKAKKNMMTAHKECYQVCKKMRPEMPVGITQFCNTFDFVGILGFINKLIKKFEDHYNWWFFDETIKYHDFIGLDYYATFQLSISPPFFRRATKDKAFTDMKWGIYPQGFYELTKKAWEKYHKPIYIFENGLADKDDKYRADFIRDHLVYLHKAIKEGADVKGYFYWSLLDNFEWNQGYWPRFGLVEMDFETLQRRPRESYYYYREVVKNNEVKIKQCF